MLGHHSSHQHKDSNTSDSKISHHDLALILEGDQRTNVRLYLNESTNWFITHSEKTYHLISFHMSLSTICRNTNSKSDLEKKNL